MAISSPLFPRFAARFFPVLVASLLALDATGLAAPDAVLPTGEAVIRAPAGPSEIVITTTARLAGAIHSLTWQGREFIDSADHGRQLQSASNLDFGTPITGESFNPTEAGSRLDGAGARSSSRLLFLRAETSALQTVSQMAFWLAPGELSGPHPAKNTTILSDHLLTKRLRIGYKNLPHVIPYDVTFSLPIGETHHHAVFEALTGYMPPEFEEFHQFNAQSSSLEPLDDGPGEISRPIVFSVRGGTHAMGIYAPPQAAPRTTGPTFGRFRFAAAKVVKWNCVFRVTDAAGLRPGEYSFRLFVLVGDLATVTDSLRALQRESEPALP
ncbi:MAG: hypothetical protein QOE70_286 [Chthoniobacter sp.]|jgi:hypothetical protein|nr:hypothetical protein [Chthoniobacter sp.]